MITHSLLLSTLTETLKSNKSAKFDPWLNSPYRGIKELGNGPKGVFGELLGMSLLQNMGYQVARGVDDIRDNHPEAYEMLVGEGVTLSDFDLFAIDTDGNQLFVEVKFSSLSVLKSQKWSQLRPNSFHSHVFLISLYPDKCLAFFAPKSVIEKNVFSISCEKGKKWAMHGGQSCVNPDTYYYTYPAHQEPEWLLPYKLNPEVTLNQNGTDTSTTLPDRTKVA